jgi:hypothetical protein
MLNYCLQIIAHSAHTTQVYNKDNMLQCSEYSSIRKLPPYIYIQPKQIRAYTRILMVHETKEDEKNCCI